ncbi:protein FAR1-RELATED SEQUENCE 5-like [Apium graveolens]|uniref:protein FAR1-RELATED SEQUENCE 5-like n=1 Tax=Apium graveolens TaxID=4045 RepID=UPI003D797E43
MVASSESCQNLDDSMSTNSKNISDDDFEVQNDQDSKDSFSIESKDINTGDFDVENSARTSNMPREERKARDFEFYYAIQLDETQSYRSIFWRDSRARKSYMKFHDVIVFDVTYKINNFSMSFAPLTGVNQHRQSILFGCALLSNEQEETFSWLFTQWRNCMWNQPPGAIITDQDSAICNAIAKKNSQTYHRYCKWHLELHEYEHLRSLQCAHPTFMKDYNKWAKQSKTIEESEESWINLRDKYEQVFKEQLTETQKNMIKSWKWVKNMYEKRRHWVKAYRKQTFFAGMKYSQRSESMNSYFDGHVNSNTPLSEFVEQYENAISNHPNVEDSEDLVSMTTTPDFTDMHTLEAHAQRVYCINILKIFQVEFGKKLHCQHYKKVVKEDDEILYEVDCGESVKPHIVDVNISTLFCKCSCAKFETGGIPCKYILYIMKQKLLLKVILDVYILPRWTLSVRYKTTYVFCGENGKVVDINEIDKVKEITELEAWTLRGELNKLYKKVITRRDLYATIEKVIQE